MKSPRNMVNKTWWYLYGSLNQWEKSHFCWISALTQPWTQTQILGKSDSAFFPALIIVAQKTQQTVQEILLLNREEEHKKS